MSSLGDWGSAAQGAVAVATAAAGVLSWAAHRAVRRHRGRRPRSSYRAPLEIGEGRGKTWVELESILGISDPAALAVAKRWEASERQRLTFIVGQSLKKEPVAVDLFDDGPNGVIA